MCVYERSSEECPFLKKKGGYDSNEKVKKECLNAEVNILDDIDESGTVAVPEADFRDLNVWPHLHSDSLMEAMFPTAVAAPAVDSVSPEEADELGRLHRRWAAVKIGITRG